MTASRPSPTCNILLVDDEKANLIALEAILEPLGQRLVTATTGREALLAALRTDFAMILLDVQMPDMDGFETAKLLRGHPRTKDVPIIFVTAFGHDRQLVSKGYDVGAVDYLVKPYEADVLRSKVAVFVELARKNVIIQAQHEALRVMSERELEDFKKRSDQRYADLADAMPEVVWTADAQGQVKYRNARFHELAGPGSEVVGIIHPDDRAAFESGWVDAVRRGTAWSTELRIGNAERGYCHHLLRVTPRRDATGDVSSWIGTSTDIDHRVRAERALRMLSDASRRLGGALGAPEQLGAVLESTLDVLGDAAILTLLSNTHGSGAAGRTLTAAKEGVDAKLLDDPRFELGPSTVAYTGRSEVHPDVAAELGETPSRGAENLRFLAELGVRSYICIPLVSRSRTIGSCTFLRFSGSPLSPDDIAVADELVRRVAVSVDNARLHEMTERRREELEQANQSKDAFLATLSHELRTPLNAIVGWTDMMRNGQLHGDELKRAVETIDRNAHALSGLVADLLDVSRIVSGSLKIDSKLVGIASVVEAAVEAARPQFAAKKIKVEIDAEPVGYVRGDAGRLRQVVANLLANALKFTPENGTVRVRVLRTDGNVTICVEDSGDGITPDLLPHVFERFRQAETARAKGLGLGLAIVKHLVEEHGGTVSAASEGAGRGARFDVLLPVAAEVLPPGEEEARASSAPVEKTDLVGTHVLVVEDDPDGNELITTILERFGAKVTSVGSGTDALAALEKDLPDVMVSDIGLPDLDGLSLIREVRKQRSAAELPAVALTAYASRQDATKAVSAGFDAHVAKPVQPSTLGGVVQRLLAAKKAPAASGTKTKAKPKVSSQKAS